MSVAQEQTVLEKIRTRGYWRVVIRPTTFERNHIPNYADLYPIVQKNSVRLRGWDYPHIDHERQPRRDHDWVGQDTNWDFFIEAWRLYLSGQFVHLFAISEDWRDQSSHWPPANGWVPGRDLNYVDTIYELLEIFEFAARLALSPAGAAFMRVEIEIHGLEGRRLFSTDILVPVSGVYVTEIPVWNHRWEGSHTNLVARPRELAALAARELFARFGLDLSVETLARLQARIGR